MESKFQWCHTTLCLLSSMITLKRKKRSTLKTVGKHGADVGHKHFPVTSSSSTICYNPPKGYHVAKVLLFQRLLSNYQVSGFALGRRNIKIPRTSLQPHRKINNYRKHNNASRYQLLRHPLPNTVKHIKPAKCPETTVFISSRTPTRGTIQLNGWSFRSFEDVGLRSQYHSKASPKILDMENLELNTVLPCNLVNE